MIDEIVTPQEQAVFSLSYKLRMRIKKTLKNPFQQQHQLMICTHHKTGTNWFRKIFEEISFVYGLTFSAAWQASFDPKADIIFDHHSYLKQANTNLRGVHIIRDPRDIIVSGYYYHLWTKEVWAHQPIAEFSGKTYQEKLNSVSKEEGLTLEIERCRFLFDRMQRWNYDNPQFMELKYEDVISNDLEVFREVFTFFDWKSSFVDQALKIVERNSFKNATNREVGQKKKGDHLRSGKPGEWKGELSSKHLHEINIRYPNVIKKLGYS